MKRMKAKIADGGDGTDKQEEHGAQADKFDRIRSGHKVVIIEVEKQEVGNEGNGADGEGEDEFDGEGFLGRGCDVGGGRWR